jgi:TrpR family trp operon transcriptional repressor
LRGREVSFRSVLSGISSSISRPVEVLSQRKIRLLQTPGNQIPSPGSVFFPGGSGESEGPDTDVNPLFGPQKTTLLLRKNDYNVSIYRNETEAFMSTATEVMKVFSSIDDTRTMRTFFEEIFTPAEIQDVALRWRLMTMLHQGIPQRQIASQLGISLCKITRGSRIIKNRQSATRKLLDKKFGECHAKLREKTVNARRRARA